jgi:hypothetical protein
MIPFNDELDVRSPKAIDRRTQTANLTTLTQLVPAYNHNTMLVWVKSEKAFYYLNTALGNGTNISHWVRWGASVDVYQGTLDVSNIGSQLDNVKAGMFFTVDNSATLNGVAYNTGDLFLVTADRLGTPDVSNPALIFHHRYTNEKFSEKTTDDLAEGATNKYLDPLDKQAYDAAVSASHTQGTDTTLAAATADQVTANELRTHLDDTTIHHEIDDTATDPTKLWSSGKIAQELGNLDSSNWEADGVGKIRPKSGNTVDASHIDNLPAGYDSTDFDNDFGTKTTDDLIEGVVNKYATGNEFDKTTDTLDGITPGATNVHLTAADKTDYDNAVSASHNQNTDTGTTSTTFAVDTSNNGQLLKSVSEELQVRTHDDSAFRDMQVRHLFAATKTTAVNISAAATIDLAKQQVIVATLTAPVTSLSFSNPVAYVPVEIYCAKAANHALTVALMYDSSVSYSIGDRVLYNYRVYIANAATTGAFDPADWDIYIKFADDVVPVLTIGAATDKLTVTYTGTYYIVSIDHNL